MIYVRSGVRNPNITKKKYFTHFDYLSYKVTIVM